MPPPRPSPPRLVTLFLLAGLMTLSLNMFLPTLSTMAVGFEVDYSVISLALGLYLASTAVLQLIIGPLSDRWGRRPILLISLAIFTGASLVCALTGYIWVFLGFRVLQGAVISAWVLALAAVRDTHSQASGASLVGYISMTMAIAPMLGPTIGGGLGEFFGWRAIFVFYSIAGAGIFVWSWIDFGETNSNRSDTLWRQFALYPELLRNKRFWGHTLCMGFATGTFYALLAGAPLVATTTFKMAPSELGMYMGSTAVGYMFGSFLAGRLSARHAPTMMMIAGSRLLIGLALVWSDVLHPVFFFGSIIFVGIGNGVTLPSASMGALSVKPGLTGSAAGLSGAISVSIGAAMTPLAGTIVTPTDGAALLLGLLLATVLVSLIAALITRRMIAVSPEFPQPPA